MTPGSGDRTRAGLARELVRVARDVVPIALVALLTFHLIRTHLLNHYRVPSRSMEPTLHGDPEHGDLVLVDKTAYWSGPPEGDGDRFALVVLRPEKPGGDHIVKRAVAFGREYVEIRHGDLFVAEHEQDLPAERSRVVKDPVLHGDMLVTHFGYPERSDRTVGAYFRPRPVWAEHRGALALRPGADDLRGLAELLSPDAQRQRRLAEPADHHLPGHLSTALPVDGSFLSPSGRRLGGGSGLTDVGMDLELELGEGWRGVQLVHEYRDRYHAFACAPSGECRFTVMGAPAKAGFVAPALRGRRVRLRFGYLDGRFFLVVGDDAWFPSATHRLDRAPYLDPKFPGPAMENLLHVAVAGAPVRVRRLRVFHDIHYRALGAPFGLSRRPYHVQPGELFLLGDNPAESHDSRHEGGYGIDHVVGRPVAVIGPLARMRWLTR